MQADGNTYERSAIARWLEKNNTSPLTGKPLRTKDLRSNLSVKQLIADWKEKRGMR